MRLKFSLSIGGSTALLLTAGAAKAREPLPAVAPTAVDNVARAIAAYERTLITQNAPADRYLAGDKTALSESAVRGLELFQNLGCSASTSVIC